MRYTSKIRQEQWVGKIKLSPKGGDLTEQQVKAIQEDLWGKEMLQAGMLIIDGVKQQGRKAEDAKKEEVRK